MHFRCETMLNDQYESQQFTVSFEGIEHGNFGVAYEAGAVCHNGVGVANVAITKAVK